MKQWKRQTTICPVCNEIDIEKVYYSYETGEIVGCSKCLSEDDPKDYFECVTEVEDEDDGMDEGKPDD